MEVKLHIPADIAKPLSGRAGALPRLALEALAAQAYKAGRIHKPDLRRLS